MQSGVPMTVPPARLHDQPPQGRSNTAQHPPMRWFARIAALALLTTSGAGLLGSLATAASAAPSTTTSYYVDDNNAPKYYNLGRSLGAADLARAGAQDRLVILSFGSPALSGGVYGVDPPGRLSFLSREQIQDTAVQFAAGYYFGVASDRASQLHLALGVTNAGSQVATNATQQGRAWSNFVGRVATAASGYSSQVQVQGAFDMEVGFGDAGSSLAMLDGFYSINNYVTYDYGDAAGCAVSGRANCVSNGRTWTLDQVYQKAWGRAHALSVPEIYNTAGTQAKQWANLSRYAVNQYGGPIRFSGTLTQRQACLDVNDACPGTNNAPDTGWTQLHNELGTQPSTAMSPQWSDDIRWGFAS